jgi:two-component system LytT family response regulator
MEDALARKQHKWFQALHPDKSVTKVVQSEPRITRIAVKNGRHYVILQTNEIDWIASARNYLEIHALGSTHLRRGTMHAFEERLGLGRFIRIHRTHLVNLDRVREIVPIESGDYEVILRNGTVLRMSRVYKQRLFSHLFL